jgi:thiamine biosynthesis lipoprotein
MGVRATAVVYAPSQDIARASAGAAFDRIAALEDVMTDYRPDSELMRLCDQAGQGPVKVSDDLLRVLAAAEAFSKMTDGSFDVTVGPLVRMWRKSRQEERLSPPEEVNAAKQVVGWKLVRLDAAASTVELERAGVQLDLGGIGKGFALDEAAAALRARGIEFFLLTLAGDVLCGKPPPGEAGWRVAVETGLGARRFLLLGAAPLLADSPRLCAVSTSGDAEQFVEIDGVRYAHIVDPATGLGLRYRVGVTVVGASATETDALATALCVLGIDGSNLVLGHARIEVVMQERREGEVRTFETAGMPWMPQ